ncbi:MAG: DUF4349 domain-containing protein [Dehalococcoidia bacterium]
MTALLLLVISALAACGGSDSAVNLDGDGSGFSADRSSGEDGNPGPAGQPGPGGAQPTPVPPPAATPASMFFSDSLQEEDAERVGLDGDIANSAGDRIIIRTVDMNLTVSAVRDAMNEISSVTRGMNGWVVSSEQVRGHEGVISVRVPAERLDEALDAFRDLSVQVESERTVSEDFTEEHTDLGSRLGALEATEQALRTLFDRAETIEDAISVQAELSKVQQEIESLQGRLDYLTQSSAFSLIRMSLRAAPLELHVDAGPDRTGAVGVSSRFQAILSPPEGVDEFTVTWDFGDGSNPVTVSRTAPMAGDGGRVTAAVSHTYRDDSDSPYVVTVDITGTGDSEVAEGQDTMIMTVSQIPVIEIFAGEDKTVAAGDELQVEGSFTRPSGLEDLEFAWDFGDGSAPVTGTLAPGVTVAAATHVYENHRPAPYRATLKISGESEAGRSEATSTLSVQVKERPGIRAAWNPAGTGRNAVNVLADVGIVAAQLGIWLAVLSPLWLIAGVVGFVLYRRRSGVGSRTVVTPQE